MCRALQKPTLCNPRNWIFKKSQNRVQKVTHRVYLFSFSLSCGKNESEFLVQLQRDLPGLLVVVVGQRLGISHLSIVGCQLAQPWLAFHESCPLLLQQPGKTLPAFVAMKDERPALMTHPRPPVPSLVKRLRGVGRSCVFGDTEQPWTPQRYLALPLGACSDNCVGVLFVSLTGKG